MRSETNDELMNRSPPFFFDPSFAVIPKHSAPPPALQLSRKHDGRVLFLRVASHKVKCIFFHLGTSVKSNRRLLLAILHFVASSVTLARTSGSPFSGNPSCAMERLPSFCNLKDTEAAQKNPKPRVSCLSMLIL